MSGQVRHACIVAAAFTALFAWLFARPVLVDHGYIAETDLYETFLPIFLSPMTTWSSFEFGGTPAFADPGEAIVYPLHFLFARVVHSWTAFIASAFVVAACGTYAYVFSITRSRLAAACAGLAYALSETLIERIAHVATLHAMAWLPLIVLAVDRLRGENWRRWIAIGAFALASCLLSGQPQIFLYTAYGCALYGLVGGLAERAGLRYYLAGVTMAVLALLMSAVKVLPVLETSLYTSRQTMNFGQFVGHANTPAQMLSMIVPAVDHEGREAPTYVGLLTLLLAFVGVRQVVGNWRVAFWLAIGVLGLILGMGDATPLASLAFELPFYDKFRIVGRHLFFAAFAASTLAGIGIAAIQRRAVSVRSLAVCAALLAVIVGAAAAAVVSSPAAFPLTPTGELPWKLPVWDNTVWGQIAIGAAAMAAVIVLFRRPSSPLAAAAIVLLVAVDGISAAAYYITPAGFAFEVLPTRDVQPSVHAERLRQALASTHQRLLSPAGTHVDAVVPAYFARVWQLPISGGYGPMRLSRYASLAMMEGNGAVEPMLLADHNAALDLMAVRFIALPTAVLEPGPVIERHGLSWTERPLSLPVGPPECGQRHTRHASYALPAGVRIRAIALAVKLRCAEDVRQATEVGTMQVIGEDGSFTIPLRAGIEVSDEGLSDPGLRSRAAHGLANVFDESASRYSYLVRAEAPQPLAGVRLEFTLSGTSGSMEVERLTAITENGTPLPLSTYAAITSDASRWRMADSFWTSRRTDRGVDENLEGEEPYVVLENLRARPRAWMVREVLPLAARERDLALHYSVLPDGRRFDPAMMALVDADTAPARYPAGPSSAQVRSIADSAITVEVATEQGGFLVLSETFYPGWSARVDGTAADVRVADGALQGVAVPPGKHSIEFVFASRTLQWGRTLSVAGSLGALAVLVWRRRGITSAR